MSDTSFQIKNKALILRFSRLGRLPPALYAAELMHENGIPTLVLEFGNLKESLKKVEGNPPRIRWASPLAVIFPQRLRPLAILGFTLIRLIYTVLKEGRPSFTVSHGWQENILVYALKRLFNIPYVVHVHEIFNRDEVIGFVNTILFDLEKRVLRNAKFLIFPEAERKKIYIERYALSCPIFLVPNCPRYLTRADGLPLREQLGLAKNTVLMAYLGGIGKDNMIIEGIEAIAKVPNLHFLIWGWGEKAYLADIKKTSNALGISDRVHLLGELKQDKWQALSGVDLSYCIYRPDLIRMRYQATASNKLFESMACSVPVISPEWFTFVTKNRLGVVAKELTAEGISQALEPVCESLDLRKSLGSTGRKLFESSYHYEKQFQHALSALQNLYFGKRTIEKFAA